MIRSTVDNVMADAALITPAGGSPIYPIFDYTDLLSLPASSANRPLPAVARTVRDVGLWKPLSGLMLMPRVAESLPVSRRAHPDWLCAMRRSMPCRRAEPILADRSREAQAP